MRGYYNFRYVRQQSDKKCKEIWQEMAQGNKLVRWNNTIVLKLKMKHEI